MPAARARRVPRGAPVAPLMWPAPRVPSAGRSGLQEGDVPNGLVRPNQACSPERRGHDSTALRACAAERGGCTGGVTKRVRSKPTGLGNEGIISPNRERRGGLWRG